MTARITMRIRAYQEEIDEMLQRDIDKLVYLANKADISLNSDDVRWFVAEHLDRDPEEDDEFLELVSDKVWFGILASC